jgi:C4-dicarboxylate transporter, DctM subunit
MNFLLFVFPLFLFISSGVWLGIAMGATGLIILYFSGGAQSLMSLAVWSFLDSYSLTSLPLYLLMGELLVGSGLTKQIFSSLAPLFERLPGKLLHTVVIISALFGAICGSSMAVAAAVGSIMYSELEERNYNRSAIVGSLAGSGTLGIMIPPSIILVLYGAWQNVSVGKLFLAGVVPGIGAAILFMIYIAIISKIKPGIIPKSDENLMPLWPALKKTVNMWPIIALILIILGTIYAGLATPTESAGMGVVGALVLGAFFGTLSFKSVGKSLFDTAIISGLIGLIIIGASILSQSIAIVGMPRQLVAILKDSNLPPIAILLSIYALYVVLGCFFDSISMLLMTLPFTFPVIVNMGFDPIWFGVVSVLVCEIGLITPPVGSNLFVLEGISKGKSTIGEISVASIPYVLLLLLVIGILTIFPEICLWLPRNAY